VTDDWCARETADLVERLTFEQQTRAERHGLFGRDAPAPDLTPGDSAEQLMHNVVVLVTGSIEATTAHMAELSSSAGFDVSVLLRLARLAQEQQRQLELLREELDALGA
jgi:hypothetical protein